MEGTISITSSGNLGFVSGEGMEEDVKIFPQFLNTACHGDTVEIALLPRSKRDTRIHGEVTKVIRRAREEFVGTLDKQDPTKNFAFVIPDDSRMQDIFLPDARSKEIRHHMKVLVKITDWGDPKKNPVGTVLKVLGKKGENEVEMQSILLESGHPLGFPPEVMGEAQKIQRNARPIPKQEKDSRKDFTSIVTFTIDPADAKDLDDALSIRKLDGGLFEVGIHVADVSHYVKEDSSLDRYAREHGTSVYLVDRTVPMLPPELSNDLCSLNPGEDKLTFSAVFTMTREGNVQDRWFGRTVIHPNARLSYEEAQQIIDTGKGAYAKELGDLNAIAQHLQRQSKNRGALDFEQAEIRFDLDPAGRPLRIYEKTPLATHKLIEEFMVLANREVAEYFSRQEKKNGGLPVYRIHEAPDQKALQDLFAFLGILGHIIQVPQKITSKELNKLFEKVRGTAEEYLVETTAMRSMEKAIYSLDAKGHFGLALDHYTHFTSPIRRYADLMTHRALFGYLTGSPAPEQKRPQYRSILANLTQREVDAMGAERSSIKYKQTEYMLQKKGEVFEGLITGVTSWGIFIQEKTTKAEGLVWTRDIPGDSYTLDEEKYALIGATGKKKYALGDFVKIQVLGGNLDQKTLDFKLLS